MCGPKSGLKPWPVSCHCHTIKTPWTRHGAPTLSIMLTRFGQTVRQIIVIMRKCPKKQHSPRDSYKLRGKKTEYQTSSAYEIGRRKLAADNLAIHMFNGKNLAIFFCLVAIFHSSFGARYKSIIMLCRQCNLYPFACFHFLLNYIWHLTKRERWVHHRI